MQGGLIGGGEEYQVTTSDSAAPAPTGVPALPNGQQPYAPAPTQQAGQGPGVTSSVDIGGMGPIDRLLAGSDWNREDVELVLQTISTLLLLYWAVTEVQ
jgi:hypothetical protein